MISERIRPPDTTAFHNFILTYHAATKVYNLYDNGTKIADVTGGTQSSPTSNITVGRAESNFYLNGVEDDLALFTKVLPTSTIQAIYNNGGGAPICTTVGCGSWTIDR